MDEIKTEQTIKTRDEMNWIENELSTIEENTIFDGEKLPTLVLKEREVTTIEVDFSQPFKTWEDNITGKKAKIIPVTHQGEKKIFFLNVKNPIYKQILEGGKNNINVFKVLRTGTQQNTRYTLVKE